MGMWYAEEDEGITNGLWVETEDRSLFIIPLGEGYDEIIGPEDTPENINLLDRLMDLWREFDDPNEIPFEKIEALGLTIVGTVLKRWNPTDGYYHA